MLMTKYEDFFFSKIMVETDLNNCFYFMPTNACFTYYINEISAALKNSENENIRKSYLIELCRNFYLFLVNDVIFKRIDSLKYADLVLLVKNISEGCSTISNKLIIEKLTTYKKTLSTKYFNFVINEIIRNVKEEKFDQDYLSYLTDLFINELLARGVDIRYIHTVASWYIEGNKFSTFKSFFNYFTFKQNTLLDIYLPIKNCTPENKITIEKANQEVIEINEKLFLHVYQNDTNDYYSVIKFQMTRILSIFNLIKLYTNSKIDFDYSEMIIVHISNQFLINMDMKLEIKFGDIVYYKGGSPYYKYFESTISNLDTLYEHDSDLYHKILNIIGYAEKDNDFINSSSYVDAWIALESLFSLPKIKTGFDSVVSVLPMIISSKIILSRFTFLLKQVFKKKRLDLVDFVKKACAGEKIQMTCSNPFYCYELNKMYSTCTNIKKLSDYYKKTEDELSLDLLRIYMLRNEYVHESKLSAFNSLQFYKLKNILTLSIDAFFSMIDQKIEYIGKIDDFAFSVFSSLIEKNENRRLLFKVCNENVKLNSGKKLILEELDSGLELSDLMINILLNNNKLNEKFKKYVY